MKRHNTGKTLNCIRKFRHMKVSCAFCVNKEDCMHHNYPLCTNDIKLKQFDEHAFEIYDRQCPNDLKERLYKK